jgi:ascorbate-specific PTS system EIIC-type component UlaA
MAGVPGFVPGIILAMGIPILLISVLALVGGIFGVQRKHWGWALAGSIAAIIAFLPLGIASTVFTAQSKGEFE